MELPSTGRSMALLKQWGARVPESQFDRCGSTDAMLGQCDFLILGPILTSSTTAAAAVSKNISRFARTNLAKTRRFVAMIV